MNSAMLDNLLVKPGYNWYKTCPMAAGDLGPV